MGKDCGDGVKETKRGGGGGGRGRGGGGNIGECNGWLGLRGVHGRGWGEGRRLMRDEGKQGGEGCTGGKCKEGKEKEYL